MNSFYWYDYETTGSDVRLDRPVQFGGLRTDLDLNEIGRPDVFWAEPAEDVLPHPMAVLVTGVLPQEAAERGESEYLFARRVAEVLSKPGTCAVGYNSLRFDAEVTRYLFWRNLLDPYAHEWRDGNSRWDLLDLMRACRLMRPEGLDWPDNDEGQPSFRLEHLTAANGIEHGDAHDALADVRATLALARKVKSAQPRLFAHALSMRNKQQVLKMLELGSLKPLLHVSGRFAAAQGAASVILPLFADPVQSNRIVCWDLRIDPTYLLDTPPDTLHNWLYSRADDLPEGAVRPGIKHVHLNRAPVLAPASVLKDSALLARMQLDLDEVLRHLEWIRNNLIAVNRQLMAVLDAKQAFVEAEPEAALYDGFVSDVDRRRLVSLLEQVEVSLHRSPSKVSISIPSFADPRLPVLVKHFLARNLPQALDETGRAEWRSHCRMRLGLEGERPARYAGVLDFAGFEQALAQAITNSDAGQQELLRKLAAWAEEKRASLSV